MEFELGHLYHIYSQGNNRRKIFYNRKNYLFFLKKLNTHILPYADIVAWCLMPNHFHLMVRVNKLDIKDQEGRVLKSTTFNKSIGIMLASYTRAINKEKKMSGSLFRSKTKAECLSCNQGVSPSYIISEGITSFVNLDTKKQYPQVCFEYIHQNPVKARLVKDATDWEFSSAIDYAGLRNGKLANKKLAQEILIL
jgi:putative transposase